MKESGNENKSLAFILKYFRLGTIASAEVKKYERSRKRILNLSLGMVIGSENIHYKILYTEEEIVYNSISWANDKYNSKKESNNKNVKKDRKSTILEKIEFINNTIKEFNEYYGEGVNITILTTFDDDIRLITKEIDNIVFEIIDKKILNNIIKDNKIDNDIFYKEVMEFKKREFKSIVDVKKKINNMINPIKYNKYTEDIEY
ncbi:hypothetical protein FC778_11525 [Clostridium botulinum]|nr:hypothetical protein [Clostridium botulinum]